MSSREGQGGEKISLSSWPWQECWCPGRLCHRVHAVLMAVLGCRGVSASLWQRQNCTAGTLFPTKFPNWGNLGTHQRRSRRGVSPWCRKQTCLACHFFSLLWIETSTAPLAPASCEGSPQSATREAKSSEGRNRHATHTQESTGSGEGTGLKHPEEPWQGGSSTLLLCSRGHGLARSRIQAQGPTFAQAAKPKQS